MLSAVHSNDYKRNIYIVICKIRQHFSIIIGKYDFLEILFVLFLFVKKMDINIEIVSTKQMQPIIDKYAISHRYVSLYLPVVLHTRSVKE